MKDMKLVASYIAGRYHAVYGVRIDEMKLQKLMYLAQRESLAQTNEPLFDSEIQGWRLGPVIPELRGYYKSVLANEEVPVPAVDPQELGEDREAVDTIFNEYAGQESLSLSRMTHGEICWRKSRKGIPPNESSSTPIPLDDIRLDAVRSLGLLKIMNNIQ